MKQGRYAQRIGGSAAVHMAAVLEYVVEELFLAASDIADEQKKKTIFPRHIQLAIKKDDEFSQLFANCTVFNGGVLPFINKQLVAKKGEKVDGTQEM